MAWTIPSQVVSEGDGTVVAELTMSEVAARDVHVAFSVSGTAIAPDDHDATDDIVTIPAGSTVGALIASLVDDSSIEGAETLVLTLEDAVGGRLGAETAHTITINDNEAGVPVLSWQSADQTVNEDVGMVTVTAGVTNTSASDITAAFTLGGSATNTDHDLVAGTLTITAGNSTGQVAFNVIDDNEQEMLEAVQIILGTPTGANLGAPAVHTVRINDDDGVMLPSVTVTSPNGGELWRVGETRAITWSSSNVTGTIDILYSVDDGSNWLVVSSGEIDTGSYPWTVPNAPTLEALLWVRASDMTADDFSDAVFEIRRDPGTIYVDAGAAPAGDGSTWGSALRTIPDAVAVARAGDEIWVAAATYGPPAMANSVVSMIDGVAIYGGFVAGATTRSQADPSVNLSILDGQGSVDHVVVGASNVTLDGFVITGGLADGMSPDDGGAGMLVDGEVGMIISRCTFDQSSATARGGGLSVLTSQVDVLDSVFTQNAAALGGALYAVDSTVTVTRTSMEANVATTRGAGITGDNTTLSLVESNLTNNQAVGLFGGGIAVSMGAATVERTLFAGNVAFGGGGLYVDLASVWVRNSVFYGNQATAGGAVAGNNGTIDLVHSTVSRNQSNSAALGGDRDSSYWVRNTVLWGNVAPRTPDLAVGVDFDVAYSNLEQRSGFTDGGGNLHAEPNFVDADYTGAPGSIDPASASFALAQGSPCIDAADDTWATLTDFLSNPRVDDPGMPTTGIGFPGMDIGAYEFQGTTTLVLTSPDGGEMLDLGSGTAVTWTASGPTDVKIELRCDGATAAIEIIASTPASAGTFTWDPIGGMAAPRCRVTVTDASDPGVFDHSNGSFDVLSTGVLHVDGTVGMSGDGSNWLQALQTIGEALAVAAYGDEVRVAGGTYTNPGMGHVVQMVEGVDLLGGYDASTGLRDIALNPTVLDGGGVANHVVVGADALLSGFIIEGGDADNVPLDPGWGSAGGGMLVDGASPVVSDCTFRNNTADLMGGAVFVAEVTSAPVFDNVTFEEDAMMNGNSALDGGCMFVRYDATATVRNSTFTGCAATGAGGAIAAADFAVPVVENSVFTGNTADSGGAVSWSRVQAGGSITGSIFAGNSAAATGGAVELTESRVSVVDTVFTGNQAATSGGAAFVADASVFDDSDVGFTNCVFDRNTAAGLAAAQGGGALLVREGPVGSLAVPVAGSTFWGNTAMNGLATGGAISHDGGSLTVTNTIAWGNADSAGTSPIAPVPAPWNAAVTYSNIEGHPAGATQDVFGNLGVDPVFVDVISMPPDLALDVTSPCIDAANGDAALATDILGVARTDVGAPGGGVGTPDYVDMGAYEYVP